MKIAINLFQVDNIGGIYTYVFELKKGLEILGHTVEIFWLTKNKKFPTSPYPEMKPLMFENKIEKYYEEMTRFDLVIFAQPCPYIQKHFTSTNWQKCYNINKPIIVAIHDQYYESRYNWFSEVLDKVNHLALIQDKCEAGVKNLNCKKVFTGHPVDLSDSGLYNDDKNNVVLSCNQFRTWKHVDVVIRNVPKIKGNVRVFNNGIEKAYMSGSLTKRKTIYKDNGEWIWERALNHGMFYGGEVLPPKIYEEFKKAKILVNLARFRFDKNDNYPNLDYVTLEGIKYGCVPLVQNTACQRLTKFSFIFIDIKIESDISLSINDIIQRWDEFEALRFNNLKEIKNFECSLVAKRTLGDFYD